MSETVRAIGPTVSWGAATPITPERLMSPTVGFRPTMPLMEDGRTTDPSTSAPRAAVHRLAATDTAEPEDCDPDGLRSRA